MNTLGEARPPPSFRLWLRDQALELCGSESSTCHLTALRPRETYVTSLCLSVIHLCGGDNMSSGRPRGLNVLVLGQQSVPWSAL